MATTHEVPFVVWTRSLNCLFVGLIVPEILRFIDFGVLAWNCLFTPSWKLIWCHVLAVDVPIWTKFGSRMQNNTPITAKWSRSKPELEFQYGGRLYFENGNSYISAANWDISTKFGLLIDFELLKAVTSTNTKLEVVFSGRGRGRHVEK